MAVEFRIKRIYAAASPDDGARWLVDRLWPRGISKQAAQIDVWAKDLTPSHELRKWFHAHPDDESRFASWYLAELEARIAEITRLFADLEASSVTLVTAVKEPARGHVAILQNFLQDRFT
ncbi:MAG: DUF488 domain-containing protein [Planctomycetota bacterium]|jgi:uncharacterized protein YeaO (DUF488 family)